MKKRNFNELTIVYNNNSIDDYIDKLKKDLVGCVYFLDSNNKLAGYYDILSALNTNNDINTCTYHNKIIIDLSKTEWYGDIIKHRNEFNQVYKNSVDLSCTALPIVNSDNFLLGDITFYDEYISFIRRNISILDVTRDFFSSKTIYVIKPRFAELFEIYSLFIENLQQCSIKFIEIKFEQINNVVNIPNSYFVFSSYQDLLLCKIQYKIYSNFFCIKSFIDYVLDLNKKIVLGKLLTSFGVKICVFNLSIPNDIKNVPYIKNYIKVMKYRKTICVGKDYVIPEQLKKSFLADLYTDDYWNFFKSRRYLQYKKNGITYLRDVSSPLLNIVNGRRIVSFQQELDNTCNNVFFYGRCTFVGSRVEDKNTIPSIIQNYLNNDHLNYKVFNESSWDDENGRIWKILNHDYKSGDVIVIQEMNNVYGSVEINGARLAYNNNISFDCFTDHFAHANHIALKCYADGIYSVINEQINKIDESSIKAPNSTHPHTNISIRKDYIKRVYIDRYFSNYHFSETEVIGCIVMNCNPFTLGHRYLIENAASRVDRLIIFVVEENKSYFSFLDRLSMVEFGVSHLENVIVVPSGDFILSSSTFPEYFIKIMDEDISLNVDFDITLFAECIAEPLGIKFRFVGQELTDDVTNEYNKAMHKILPHYGIKVVELERLTTDDTVISASLVRKYFEFNLYDRLSKFVPQTTLSYLFINSISNQGLNSLPSSVIIIYSFISDDYCCKVYSDGSCEQSGSYFVTSEILPLKSLSFDVLLHKEFLNDKYSVNISISFLTEHQKYSSGGEINIYSKHKKSFKVSYHNRNRNVSICSNFVIHWLSIGRVW